MRPDSEQRTLALYPDRRGFGWVAFTNPMSVHDFGRPTVRGSKNVACLRKIEALLDLIKPETVVLESYARPNSKRVRRTTLLCQAIAELVVDRGIELAIYTRADVSACFLDVGARTRDEIAAAVSRHVPALKDKLPVRRKAWQAEDPRMALFSAAALVLTHYRLGARTLFDELST